jgi:hypothetical protein
VVIALVVTPDGLPLAYEVMAGNTSDKTTLRDFIERIESQYGKARRTWVMDRGIPTEEMLAEMRASEAPIQYLVGTPRGRLGQLEQDFLTKPWTDVRDTVQVKLVEQDDELYVLAPQWHTPGQGTGDAPAATEETAQAPARTAAAEADS